jgi:hypothetical protein
MTRENGVMTGSRVAMAGRPNQFCGKKNGHLIISAMPGI